MTEQRPELASLDALLGPLYDITDLDATLQQQPGLVRLKTEDGFQLCPVSQFVNDTEGNPVALRPELSAVWAAYRVLDEQLSEDEYTTLTILKTPQERWGGHSWWDLLTCDPLDQDDFERMKRQMHKEITQRASQYGIVLLDPRTTL